MDIDRIRNFPEETAFRPIDKELAIVPYIDADSHIVLVTKPLLKHLGVNMEVAIDIALQRDMSRKCAVIKPLDFPFNQEPTFVVPESNTLKGDLFVLSNPEGIYGSSVIAYQDTLEDLSMMLGEGFYLLPASIHEMLVVRESVNPDIEDLKDMVRSINMSIVSDRDFLSNKVFHYDKELGKLMSLGEAPERGVTFINHPSQLGLC